MTYYAEKRKSYKTPRSLANAVVVWSKFRTDSYYFLTTPIDEDDVVVVLDTTAPLGPVSGNAIWRVEIQPHSWGQEVAELIWEALDWDEVTEDSHEPGSDVVAAGWSCRMIVPIEL
jgi:hypothetical protein